MDNALNEYVDRINYDYSKAKPMTNDEINSTIVEVYTDYLKENSFENFKNKDKKEVTNFDEFFYKNMVKMYKIREIAKEKIESLIFGLKSSSNIIINNNIIIS